jgi:hypothetical protein
MTGARTRTFPKFAVSLLMMGKFYGCMVLFLLLAPIVIAQQCVVSAETPFVAKVENAIRSSESGWRCTRGILNAPPPLVPSERVLVVSDWEHTSESGKRESADVEIFEVGSRTDAKLSLNPMREGKVAKGWKVQRLKIGDEGYLATFMSGARFEIHFSKGTIVAIVSSDSLRIVERFAQHVAAQIDAI